jgi:hypothetical protein
MTPLSEDHLVEKAFGSRLKPLGQKLKAEFNSAGAFQEEVEE